MNRFRSVFAISSSSIVLTLAFSAVDSVQAVMLQSFSVDVTQGGLAGQTFEGSFQYDESLLIDSGQENLAVSDGLAVSFDFLGTTFTEANDLGFTTGLFPNVSFTDSVFSGLSYLVETGDLFFTIDAGQEGPGLPGTLFSYEIGPIAAPTDTGSGILSLGDTTKVPEPTMLLGLAIAVSLGLISKKQMT